MEKNKKVKISYDKEADVLSWEIYSSAKISHAKEMGNIIVHLTKNNEPVVVEVLEASKLFKQNSRSLRHIGEVAGIAR